MKRKRDIEAAQPATIEDHLSLIVNDTSVIESTPRNVSKNDLPEWYNEKLFKAGQNYYRKNLLGMGAASMAGLLAVLVIPSILKILVWTKKSGTACTAFTRYLETLLHIYSLYIFDIDDPDSRFWKSINMVRYLHSTNSRRSTAAGVGGITHRDMALTQFGFIGYALVEPRKLGLTNEAGEREGFNHFWKVAGNLLGISDSLNICRKNEAETTELCRRLITDVFRPQLEKCPENFPEMTYALLDGMWCVDPMLNYDSMMSFFYELNKTKYDKPLGFISRLSSMYRTFLFAVLGYPVIGSIVRIAFNYNLMLTYWLLEHWRILARLRFGKKQSDINLYGRLKS